MEIIDVHVHIYPPERQQKLLRWLKRSFKDHPLDDNISADEIIEDLQKHGIGRFINLVYPLSPEETESLNEFNANLARDNKNIYSFGSLNQKNKNKKDIIKSAFYDLGLMGLKFHPFIQRIDLRDPAMEEVWTICEELKRPVFLHTGYEDFYGCKMPPSCVRTILERHPELYLVLNHILFPDLKAAFDIARDFQNVYLDLTNIPGSFPFFTTNCSEEEYIKALKNGIHEFPGRIFFGTDHPVGMGSLSEIFEQLKGLNLNADDYKMVTYTAADRFIEKFKL